MVAGDLDADGRVVELFRALAHPTRIEIVRLLEDGPLAVHELVAHLGCAQPTATQHLSVLRGARLIRCERCGREMRYELADTHVSHIIGDAVRHAQEPA